MVHILHISCLSLSKTPQTKDIFVTIDGRSPAGPNAIDTGSLDQIKSSTLHIPSPCRLQSGCTTPEGIL